MSRGGLKETARGREGWKGERKREIGEEGSEREGKKKKKKRIRGFSRRRVEWLGGRIIELPLIPSSPLCRVKRGKKPAEKAAQVRPKLVSVSRKRVEGWRKTDIDGG